MKWTVHPAKENATKTVISLIFIIVFLLFIVIAYNIYWALLGFLFLVATLHSYYFPTSYEITEDEVIVKTIFAKNKRKLSEFKKTYAGKNGILLSPFRHKTFLNNFRGVFLLVPNQNKQEIMEFVNKKISENVG